MPKTGPSRKGVAGTIVLPVNFRHDMTFSRGMAEQCRRYRNRLAQLLEIKRGEDYSTTIAWVRTKVSFAILRVALLSLRGSRTIKRRNNLDMGDADLDV